MEQQELTNRIKQIHLVSRRLAETILGGNYSSVFKGPGLEFNEVREYLPGDDVRFIDWNVSSRMGQPYSKTFREEREMLLQVLIDLSASSFQGSVGAMKRDVSGTLFALLAQAALVNNDRVGSLLFTDKIEGYYSPQKGTSHVMRQLGEVLKTRPEGRGSDLALALRTATESLKRRGISFIISDFRTTGYKKELSLYARKHDVIALRLTHPLDHDLPSMGLVRLQDMEQHRVINFLGLSKKQREKYHQFWEMEFHSWQNSCRSMGVDTVVIDVTRDPADQLIQYLQLRKRRKR